MLEDRTTLKEQKIIHSLCHTSSLHDHPSKPQKSELAKLLRCCYVEGRCCGLLYCIHIRTHASKLVLYCFFSYDHAYRMLFKLSIYQTGPQYFLALGLMLLVVVEQLSACQFYTYSQLKNQQAASAIEHRPACMTEPCSTTYATLNIAMYVLGLLQL